MYQNKHLIVLYRFKIFIHIMSVDKKFLKFQRKVSLTYAFVIFQQFFYFEMYPMTS